MMKTRMTQEEKTSFREYLASKVLAKGSTVRALGDKLPKRWSKRFANQLGMHQAILYHLRQCKSVEIRGGHREKKYIFPALYDGPDEFEVLPPKPHPSDGAQSQMRIDRKWCCNEIDTLAVLESDCRKEIARLEIECRKAQAKRAAMEQFVSGLDKLMMLGTFTQEDAHGDVISDS